MDAFHVVCGMPRSGSTLLCDVLCQNPDFHASSTSILDRSIGGLRQLWSSSPEVKSLLLYAAELRGQPEGAASDKIADEAMRAFCTQGIAGWYSKIAPGAKVVFDKGRGWLEQYEELQHLFPQARLVCTVRDPRDAFASVERTDKRTPLLAELGAPIGETRMQKIERYFSPVGMLGANMRSISDKLSLKVASTSLVYVTYEKFCADPERELRRVYAELKLDWWSGHNFEEVAGTAIDLDVAYNLKFPHRRKTGPIRKSDTRWQDWIPTEVGDMIVKQNPVFCKEFGYQ